MNINTLDLEKEFNHLNIEQNANNQNENLFDQNFMNNFPNNQIKIK